MKQVNNGDIHMDGVNEYLTIPAHSKAGKLKRMCTKKYKIDPIHREIRKYLGHTHPRGGRIPPGIVKMSLGISYDEYERMAISRTSFIENIYPLVDRKITREDCINYFISKDLPVPPKSSCACCPFQRLGKYSFIKKNFPEEWEELKKFDARIRKDAKLGKGWSGELFLNPKQLPIEGLVEYVEESGYEDVCESGYCFV